MRETLRQFLGAALLLGVTVAGCKQSEGERCEVTGDCAAGLICNIPVGSINGTCGTTASTTNVDAASRTDVAAPVAPDTAVPLDQAASSSDAPTDGTDAHPEVAPVAPDGPSGS